MFRSSAPPHIGQSSDASDPGRPQPRRGQRDQHPSVSISRAVVYVRQGLHPCALRRSRGPQSSAPSPAVGGAASAPGAEARSPKPEAHENRTGVSSPPTPQHQGRDRHDRSSTDTPGLLTTGGPGPAGYRRRSRRDRLGWARPARPADLHERRAAHVPGRRRHPDAPGRSSTPRIWPTEPPSSTSTSDAPTSTSPSRSSRRARSTAWAVSSTPRPDGARRNR